MKDDINREADLDTKDDIDREADMEKDAQIENLEQIKYKDFKGKASKRKRRKDRFFLKLAVFVVAIIGIFLFLSSSYFDVKEITTTGNDRISDKEIVKLSGIKKETNIFTVRKKLAVGKLEGNSYVGSAKIVKNYPDKIVIEILERKPSAAIKYGNKFVLINDQAYALETREKRPRIVYLEGIKMKKFVKGEQISPNNKTLLTESMDMVKRMKKSDLYFKKIDMRDPDEAKLYIDDMLVIKGDKEAVNKNLENGNIGTIVYDIYKKKIKRGTIIINNSGYCSFTPIF
ncbi:MAG: FtsQ-type POTRA domain-containing protein [Anaerovoracaceae bacterium]